MIREIGYYSSKTPESVIITTDDIRVHCDFGVQSTGETRQVEGVTEQLYKCSQFVYWGETKNRDAEKMKSVFIREYLEYKGCGINEQIAAMANGGIDLTTYQALRVEAKATATEFLTAWNIYLSKSKDSITDK